MRVRVWQHVRGRSRACSLLHARLDTAHPMAMRARSGFKARSEHRGVTCARQVPSAETAPSQSQTQRFCSILSNVLQYFNCYEDQNAHTTCPRTGIRYCPLSICSRHLSAQASGPWPDGGAPTSGHSTFRSDVACAYIYFGSSGTDK